MRNRSNSFGHSSNPQAHSRAVILYWVVGLGIAATAALTAMSMVDALSGRDARSMGLLAMLFGVAVSLAAAIAPAFVKRQPSVSASPAPTGARRTAFVSLSSLWLSLYVLAISNVHWLLGIDAWPFWTGVAAAAVATLSVGGLAYALLRYLARDTDEYQRVLLMRAALVAAGLTFFALTVWGLAELYVGAPHLPMALTLVPFFLFFAITNWWVRGRT